MNKSKKQYQLKQQMYGHIPPILQTIQVWRTSHARHCFRSKDELTSDILFWALKNMDTVVLAEQPRRQFRNSMQTLNWFVKGDGR